MYSLINTNWSYNKNSSKCDNQLNEQNYFTTTKNKIISLSLRSVLIKSTIQLIVLISSEKQKPEIPTYSGKLQIFLDIYKTY